MCPIVQAVGCGGVLGFVSIIEKMRNVRPPKFDGALSRGPAEAYHLRAGHRVVLGGWRGLGGGPGPGSVTCMPHARRQQVSSRGKGGGGMELRGYSFEPFVFYFCVARYFIRYYVSPRLLARKLGIYIHTLCVLFVSSPVHYYPQARVSMGACGRAVPRQSARRRRPARGLGRAAPLVRG